MKSLFESGNKPFLLILIISLISCAQESDSEPSNLVGICSSEQPIATGLLITDSDPSCSIILDEGLLDGTSPPDLLSAVGFKEADISLKAGDSLQLQLGNWRRWVYFQPIQACNTWSVDNLDGVSLSQEGLLTISPLVPHGAKLSVIANIENGRRIVSTNIHVYNSQCNPFVGRWKESSQLTCDTEQEILPEKQINEIVFTADGEYTVTWMPFEVYIDYWGNYTYDISTGVINLSINGGNYIPSDFDGTGKYNLDQNNDIILNEIWFGSPSNATKAANCGHLITKDVFLP